MSRSQVIRSTAVTLALALAVAGCGGTPAVLSTVGNSVSGDGQPGVADPAPQGGDQEGIVPTIAEARDGAKIVRTGTLQLQVGDLEAAVAHARDVVGRLGGYISDSSRQNAGEESTAVITYRIPADRWEEGLAGLRAAGVEVIAEETRAVEVTGQLVDLEAQIANLRASEKALQGIAEGVAEIKDVLSVQEQLSKVRGEIERLDAQRLGLDDRATYATLTVTFGLQVAAVAQAARGWNPAAEVDQATATLVDVVQALATAGIWFGIVWLPILLVIAVVVAIGAFVVRRISAIRAGTGPQPA